MKSEENERLVNQFQQFILAANHYQQMAETGRLAIHFPQNLATLNDCHDRTYKSNCVAEITFIIANQTVRCCRVGYTQN